jgi:hypothetical protein
MIIDRPARLRYYAEARPGVDITRPTDGTGPRAELLASEGPHSVENVDDHDYHAFRIEYARWIFEEGKLSPDWSSTEAAG